jgi:hypothetical protein
MIHPNHQNDDNHQASTTIFTGNLPLLAEQSQNDGSTSTSHVSSSFSFHKRDFDSKQGSSQEDSICQLPPKEVSFSHSVLVRRYERQQEEQQQADSSSSFAFLSYYAGKDYELFRKDARLDASRIESTVGGEQMLHIALDQTCLAIDSLAQRFRKHTKPIKVGYQEEFSRVFQKIDETNIIARAGGIGEWSLSSLRGLERLASIPRRASCSLARKHQYEALEKFQESSLLLDEDPELCRNRRSKKRLVPEEELARRLQRRSLSSRLMARLMGMADEWAVHGSSTTTCSASVEDGEEDSRL